MLRGWLDSKPRKRTGQAPSGKNHNSAVMDRNAAKQKMDTSDTLPVEMWAEVVGWLHRDCTRPTHPTGHGGAHARSGGDGAADRNFLLRSVALVSPLWRCAFEFYSLFFCHFTINPHML